ncbi:MAG: hypothetical protein ACFCVE_01700 [Phycisphaerae bacterium]
MSTFSPDLAAREVFAVFDARRVKSPELKNIDTAAHAIRGWVKNRTPILPRLRKLVKRVNALEPEVQKLSDARFAEEVERLRQLGRLNRLHGPDLDKAYAIAREAAWRTLQKRPFDVQIMGAAAMTEGYIAEMATGEGKTMTAAVAASIWAWAGKPVHVITVNDYLVSRDAELNEPLYRMLGHRVGHVVHETTPQQRLDMYRRNVVYVTSKELVADFLRDQIAFGELRTSTQTAIGLLNGVALSRPALVPGLFKVIVDEADSLLIDEAVTPLIISSSPGEENPNLELYQKAHELAKQLKPGRDFKIDRPVRQCELNGGGQRRLAALAEADETHRGFWQGARRREELVVQALNALYCFNLDEHYLITPDKKIVIVDENTGRVMADRSWRSGLHQAVEIKEGVPVTSDKENLARLSFQRFFRQYPIMAGMTGTAWESGSELWGIFHRPVARVPTNKRCVRRLLPTRMFTTGEQKWEAVVARVCELNDRGIPVLVGTRSVWASEEVSRRLTAAGRQHEVLNARQDSQEASIVSQAGQAGRITVATNMAGRGTDIHINDEVKKLGGLHVIATEPHGSARVDRQLFGRAARQGDPGCAQLFASCDDDLFKRHAKFVRRVWRLWGADRTIRWAQAKAERLARFNRKQVLRSDDWMDQQLPF